VPILSNTRCFELCKLRRPLRRQENRKPCNERVSPLLSDLRMIVGPSRTNRASSKSISRLRRTISRFAGSQPNVRIFANNSSNSSTIAVCSAVGDELVHTVSPWFQTVGCPRACTRRPNIYNCIYEKSRAVFFARLWITGTSHGRLAARFGRPVFRPLSR
jgi:hypothetical protein